MKTRTVLVLLSLLLLTAGVSAQDESDHAQTIENLRWQLTEVQHKEADIQTRLQELEIELKPENIERYFSGYGSTRPEELREMRRRQLQSEKDRLLAQSGQLASSRVRLESAIASAEATAYQQSAQGTSVLQFIRARSASLYSSRSMGAMILLIVLGVIVVTMIVLRSRTLKP